MIILVGSNKGGSSKSTTSCNLSVALSRKNREVCLIDADRQGSSANWHAEREASDIKPQITLVQKYDNISKTVKSLSEKYDDVIIDVAGRNSREMITAAAVADILLCPLQCSQSDLDTLSELQMQVEQIKDINPDLCVLIYQTMASTNSKVVEKERTEFEEYVAEFPDFISMKSIGRYRKVYRDVFAMGLSVLETSNASASKEILEMSEEVCSYG